MLEYREQNETKQSYKVRYTVAKKANPSNTNKTTHHKTKYSTEKMMSSLNTTSVETYCDEYYHDDDYYDGYIDDEGVVIVDNDNNVKKLTPTVRSSSSSSKHRHRGITGGYGSGGGTVSGCNDDADSSNYDEDTCIYLKQTMSSVSSLGDTSSMWAVGVGGEGGLRRLGLVDDYITDTTTAAAAATATAVFTGDGSDNDITHANLLSKTATSTPAGDGLFSIIGTTSSQEVVDYYIGKVFGGDVVVYTDSLKSIMKSLDEKNFHVATNLKNQIDELNIQLIQLDEVYEWSNNINEISNQWNESIINLVESIIRTLQDCKRRLHCNNNNIYNNVYNFGDYHQYDCACYNHHYHYHHDER